MIRTGLIPAVAVPAGPSRWRTPRATHRSCALLVSAALGALSARPTMAAETVTYTYDALGRLVGSAVAGGPNNTRTTGTCFDAAGNRVRYDVASGAPASCPPPPPPPPPGP